MNITCLNFRRLEIEGGYGINKTVGQKSNNTSTGESDEIDIVNKGIYDAMSHKMKNPFLPNDLMESFVFCDYDNKGYLTLLNLSRSIRGS